MRVVVSVAGGWLAALSLAMVTAGLINGSGDNHHLVALAGPVLAAGGVMARRRCAGTFCRHFALALVLAGQWLLAGALGAASGSAMVAASATAGAAALLLPFVRDRICRSLLCATALAVCAGALY